MQQKPIVNDNISEGIDRKSLIQLRQRFEKLNSKRLERIQSALPERQRIFLSLLPLLFHVNHPILPGYVSAAMPAGVSGYSPDKHDIRLARRLARSFNCGSELNRSRQIHAIFVMGSAGTVGHSEKSDLDIWLCHNPKLSKKSRHLLLQKCKKLTQWADTLGLEAHFFPMDAEAFQRGEQADLDNEASGSTQHYLLLDEFYRTSVKIAGRMPLWWFIPSHNEKNYRDYANTLLHKRFIRRADVLDFGGVANIPQGEFVGAGIWQLYKGIDSPYKSMLKLLLLESYTRGGLQPLSLEFKNQIYSGHTDIDQLDPYVLIYHRIENYLQQTEDNQRLELARRCFYFKVGKALSKTPRGREKSWQRRLLEILVKNWHWQTTDLRRIDNRPQWKALTVIAERRDLVAELSFSYQLLLEFVRKQGANAAIDARELQVLGRKLHAAFERKAGKLEWINPNISEDISETDLLLLEHDHIWNAFACRQSQWHASEPTLKQSRNMLELLLWCYGNGVLTPTTHLDVKAATTATVTATSINTATKTTTATNQYMPQLEQLRPLRQALQQWLPLPLMPPPHEAYLQPSYCQSLLLFINSDQDPTPELREQGLIRTSAQNDPLNFGRKQHSLVATIDLISCSSWNEVSCHHFNDSENALIDALLHLLRMTPSGIPAITVHCFTPGQGTAISQRLKNLLEQINSHIYQFGKATVHRYIFSLGARHYLLQLKRGQPNIKTCANRRDLLRTLSWPQPHYSALAIDARSLNADPLQAIANSTSNATVQIYYRVKTSSNSQVHEQPQADIYIIDEKGSLFNVSVPFRDHQSLLRPLHRFLRRVLERHLFTDAHHNPDFGVKPIDFFEIGANLSLIQRNVSTELNKALSRYYQFDIEVIVERNEDGSHYSVICAQQEFSSLIHGRAVFQQVAKHILKQRPSGERYPCFITDLDISQCAAHIAGDHSLQIIHYLHLKTELETQINQALQIL